MQSGFKTKYINLRFWLHFLSLCIVGFGGFPIVQNAPAQAFPLFDASIFYQVDMEFCNDWPMNIGGYVFCNTDIYFAPSASLLFSNDVAMSDSYFYHQNPLDPTDRSSSNGGITFNGAILTNLCKLWPPVGRFTFCPCHPETENYPMLASSIGPSNQPIHFFCLADLIVLVSNKTITATSGFGIDNQATAISSAECSKFIKLGEQFYNWREAKFVRAVHFDVGKLRAWSATNETLRPALGGRDIKSVYIADLSISTNFETGIVLTNGSILPPLGLGIATPNPAYIVGNWNVSTDGTNFITGTNDTSHTRPSAIYADAITILSSAWKNKHSADKLLSPQQRLKLEHLRRLMSPESDTMKGNQRLRDLARMRFEQIRLQLGFRLATSTTVNSALMGGIVPSNGTNYSGGVENFVRLLEDWSGETLTFDGAIACMFYSQVAKGPWGTNNVYKPPTLNWSYDWNFSDKAKLPPMTPVLFGCGGLYPMITRQPTNVTVPYGNTVKVSVPIFDLGYPTTYQWYRFGVLIASATNSTLTLSPFTSNNAGNYQAIVSYGDATAPSRGFTITAPPP